MKQAPKAGSNRRPPESSDDHGDIDDWLRRVMPDLHPIVVRLDELIREVIPKAQYAVKWKKAYYGVEKKGWVIEMVAYDVSVNVVFLAGDKFKDEPPLGEGSGRYVKVRSLDEVEAPEMRRWIEQAAKTPGWT